MYFLYSFFHKNINTFYLLWIWIYKYLFIKIYRIKISKFYKKNELIKK